jgi:3-oxoadipate enol-lactonase
MGAAAGAVKSGFADINGARLYYETAGEGFPVVLLHAGVADRRMWDAEFLALARDYRVVRYDARSFGKSPIVSGPYSKRDDLYGLLKFLGIGKACLVGCSMGGETVIDFALEHPEQTAGLVLVGAGVGGYNEWSEDTGRMEMEIFTAVRDGDLKRALELEAKEWIDGPARGPERIDPAFRARARKLLEDNFSRELFVAQLEERPLTPPAIGRLGEIRVPTLVIVGDADIPEMAKMADVMAGKIAGARKVVIPNTAHMVNMERPREFERLLIEFLAGAAR